MGLNSDKTSKVFLLFFYQILFYFCTTVTQSSRFYHNCGCFWSLHPKNQNFHCAVSSNDQYQENGFAADVLIGLKSRPNRSHRKRIYSISNIGNMMGCDHPSCKSVHWQASYGILNIFQQRPSAILNCKNFNIWSREYCPNLLLYTKFHQNWFTRSAFRRP